MSNLTDADTDDDAVDDLAELCADVMAEVRYEPVLTRLFTAPSGPWHILAELLNGFGDRQSELAELDETLDSRTRVAWLPYPDCAEGPSYATVLFFNESGMSRIWIYNRGRLIPDRPA
jgi:hypothetical protein